jgi:hypothetical protein
MIIEHIAIDNGLIPLAAPGLGSTVDEEGVREYRVETFPRK